MTLKERNAAKSRAYRARHPERARESRRRCDKKRRSKADWKPKQVHMYVPNPNPPKFAATGWAAWTEE